mmetsp:Transcript_37290/g.42837  ORF Transcript_37290/g.42837 Transcript_37290/m.42837 type:complete len:241 (+) Transcript_37290:171-893(+)
MANTYKTHEIEVFQEVISYTALADCVVYLFRWYLLRRRNCFHEQHLLLFLHLFVHLTIICIECYAIVLAFSTGDKHSDIQKLQLPLILLAFRIFVYFIITVVVILFLPCILMAIINKRRNRYRLIEDIRFQRRSGSLASIVAPNRNDFEQRYQPLPAERQPLNNVDFFDNRADQPRRSNINDVLLNLIHGVAPVPERLDQYSRLKRVTYASEEEKLDYPECPICVTEFCESPEEMLIYLP